MASAKPAADQTAFEQGAGRIDVAKAILQSVIAEPGSVSFGTALWPHHDDTPVTKTLTYRNLGDEPVTLQLAVTLMGPGGEPAPAAALKLSATTVTVPTAGAASVQATSNTNHSGPDGGYSGRITATGSDTTVESVIGVTKEKESYDLTLNHIGIEGKPVAALGMITGVDVEMRADTYEATTKLRLPKGEYNVEGLQIIGDLTDIYSVLQPSVSLTRDTTVVLDARTAKPIRITVPNTEASLLIANLGYDRASAGGRHVVTSGLAWADDTRMYSAQVGPLLPPERMTGHVSSQWVKEDENGSIRNSPYLYAQVESMPGFYPTGFLRDVTADQLAVVEQRINATSDRQFDRSVHAQAPYLRGGTWAGGIPYDAPATTKLLMGDKQATWETFYNQRDPDPGKPYNDFTLSSLPKTYEAGRTYRERYNAAAFTPSPVSASRLGDRLLLWADPVSDADGNKGRGPADSQSSKLIKNEQVIAESPSFGRIEALGLPAEKATYTLHASQTRHTHSTFSTRTDLNWTFTSAATPTKTMLPMLGVRYQPTVDRHNVAERKPVTVLPVTVDAAPGQALPGIKTLEIQVSGDDGMTWLKTTVTPTGTGTYKATFTTPKNAKTVSLKAHLQWAYRVTLDHAS